MAKKKTIVVDGANLAYEETTGDGKPKVSNLVAARQALQERGYTPIIIVDAALRHEIDDPDQLEALFDAQAVRQAPAGTDADFFVLKTADNEGARVVSNDRYDPYQQKFPWIRDRRVPFMIVRGEVEFYKDVLSDGAGESGDGGDSGGHHDGGHGNGRHP